jgi:hypothetical protein
VTEIVLRHGGSARFVEVDEGSRIELRVRRDSVGDGLVDGAEIDAAT